MYTEVDGCAFSGLNDFLLNLLAHLGHNFLDTGRVYAAVGHELMQSQFARVVGQLLTRGIKLTCRIVPGGDHCEASWEKQIPFFINTLMYELEL